MAVIMNQPVPIEDHANGLRAGIQLERADVELITVRLSPPTTLFYLEEPSRAMMGGSGSDENVEGHGQSTPNSGLGLAQWRPRGVAPLTTRLSLNHHRQMGSPLHFSTLCHV